MKYRFFSPIVLTLALLLTLAPITAYAYTRDGTTGDELQLMEAQQLEIQLGADWAGVEFQLKTDAGLYPGTITVAEDGVLRMEIGGSKAYTLTCLQSSVSAPAPQPLSSSTESLEAPTEDVIVVPVTESGKTISGIPVTHIILFAGGMIVAIVTLIAMHICKKRKTGKSSYDEDDFPD